ncbi:MAG: hypothetical protein P4L03_07270 [Terracidiphilus sp.]|nr:hypothetical protein [Terracidiphilus sp.]
MKNLKIFGAMALVGVGLVVLAGCKSAPELATADAQKLIQAKYDAQPAAGVNITVSDLGMQQGANGKLWARTKVYPNRYWADFTLTPEGKKALKLVNGGDTIQWRPNSVDDKSFVVVITTATATRPKIKEIQPAQDAGAGKSVTFTEAANLEGVNDVLQQIAHNPGNKLSDKKTANFVLDGNAWKLDSIQ